VVRVFSRTVILAVPYSSAVRKLRRPLLSNRYCFITVRRLKRRATLIETDFIPFARAFNQYSGLNADEEKRRCGLMIDRVRMPSGPRTRI